MSQPPGYSPTTDFSDDEANALAGRSTVRTANLDAEFVNLASTLSAILTNLALIQRDDTNLADRIVKLHALADDVRAVMATAGTNPRGDWVTATAYAAKDVVTNGTGTYICVTAHTSGVFATDHAADKWIVIFDTTSYAASGITFSPTGTIASTTVQLAIAEAASEAAQKASNLSDLASANTARANLGFPTIAAKGDLIVGSAANTLVKLAAGTDGFDVRALAAATSGLMYLPPSLGFTLLNGSLQWNVSGNALTCSVRAFDGSTPTTTNPVFVLFRSATAAETDLTLRKITAATQLTVNNTATLGTSNATAFKLWAVLFDNAGTLEIGLINCLSGTNIFPLAGWGIASSTAMGTGADSAHVFYTTNAQTAKAYAVLGSATWETGLAAAGVWSAAPTREQLFGPGVPLPGHVIQTQRTDTGAVATGTTVVPNDDTIPQITEGDQFMSQAITPTSAANVLCINFAGHFTNSATGQFAAALFQDAVSNALKTAHSAILSAASPILLTGSHVMLSALAVSTTFRVRGGKDGAGTTTFNGSAGARLYGGVLNSYVEAMEIQA